VYLLPEKINPMFLPAVEIVLRQCKTTEKVEDFFLPENT
jgi:hypothetical protein